MGDIMKEEEVLNENDVALIEKRAAQTEDEVKHVEYTDKSGHVVKYYVYDGIHFSYFFKIPVIKRVNHFQFRHDDVYLLGYPRTGTHWANEMLMMLLQGSAETVRRVKPHIEMCPDALVDLPSPRAINAHIPMSRCPPDLLQKKPRVVYTLRDPRDVAVSLHKLRQADKRHFANDTRIEDFLPLFLEGKVSFNCIFDHIREAETFADEHPDIPIHFHSYEQALQNPVEAVQKMSDFLGLARDDALCKAISDKCDYSTMKVDKKMYSMERDGVGQCFRNGKAGDWRNHFNEQMLADYYKVYDDKMANSRFYSVYAGRQTHPGQ